MNYIMFYPYPLVAGLLIVSLIGFLLRRRGWAYVAAITLLGIYSLLLADAMFFPFHVPEGWPASANWEDISVALNNSLNLIPFHFGRLFSDAALGRISYHMVFWQTIGNVLITIPYGLGTGTLTKVRGWKVLLISLGVGFALEGMQFVFILLGIGNPHVIDINDLLLNAAGVLVGYGLFKIVVVALRKTKLIPSNQNT